MDSIETQARGLSTLSRELLRVPGWEEVCPKVCQRRFACPCVALHSTAMARLRGRRKILWFTSTAS